jgi:hypothetical protein
MELVSVDVAAGTELWEVSCPLPDSVVAGEYSIEVSARDTFGNWTRAADGTGRRAVGSFTIE